MGNPERSVACGEVNPEQLDALAATLRGQLLGPRDDGYEAASRIHNGMIDHHPATIVRCAGVRGRDAGGQVRA